MINCPKMLQSKKRRVNLTVDKKTNAKVCKDAQSKEGTSTDRTRLRVGTSLGFVLLQVSSLCFPKKNKEKESCIPREIESIKSKKKKRKILLFEAIRVINNY